MKSLATSEVSLHSLDCVIIMCGACEGILESLCRRVAFKSDVVKQ